jgi:(p)ppGpp synthase/HD superfamily hydrolase
MGTRKNGPVANIIAVAQAIAERAHADQCDKAGEPYIGHAARTAERVQAAGGGEYAVAGAWLHDTLEDTNVTAEELAREGIPAEVIEAVQLLTHPHHEPYADYVWRVSGNPLAAQVKRADVADNADPRRLTQLPTETRARLERKYAQAIAILDATLASR